MVRSGEPARVVRTPQERPLALEEIREYGVQPFHFKSDMVLGANFDSILFLSDELPHFRVVGIGILVHVSSRLSLRHLRRPPFRRSSSQRHDLLCDPLLEVAPSFPMTRISNR